MILCAGLGTRLLPITEIFPKPLVPLLNIPNIVHSLALLKRAEVKEVIINLHHLSQSIENYLGNGSKWGMEISYSKETILLGTGGGLKKAEPFFSNESEPFILSNCDFVSNVDLGPIIDLHFERNALATMVLFEDPSRQASYSKVGCTTDGHLCSLPKLETKHPSRTAIFTGIHLLGKEAFSYLKEEPSGINEILYPALMKEFPERTYCDFVKHGYWYDTGDLHWLWTSSMALLENLAAKNKSMLELLSENGDYREMKKGVWTAGGEPLPAGVDFTPPILIGKNCKIAPSVSLGAYSIIGDNALIGPRASVEKTIVLPGGVIAEGKRVDHALIFNQTALSIRPLANSRG
jgi:NDP-sugar pyrophosphorylase family protein